MSGLAFVRTGMTVALAVSLAGECGPQNEPVPSPDNTVTTETERLYRPMCEVTVQVLGRGALVNLKTQDAFQPGVFDVGGVRYNYGDGVVEDLVGQAAHVHRYRKSGSYVVSGVMAMEVAPGAEGVAPIRDGQRVACQPATVEIE